MTYPAEILICHPYGVSCYLACSYLQILSSLRDWNLLMTRRNSPSVSYHENSIAEQHLAILPKAPEQWIVYEINDLAITLILHTEDQ